MCVNDLPRLHPTERFRLADLKPNKIMAALAEICALERLEILYSIFVSNMKVQRQKPRYRQFSSSSISRTCVIGFSLHVAGCCGGNGSRINGNN